MPELDTQQLDSRIRKLVGRAVADAPPPPVIDPGTVPVLRTINSSSGRPQHTRWIVGGVAALSAAAALIGIVAINRGDQIANPPAPATEPPVPTVTARTPATSAMINPPPATDPAAVDTTFPPTVSPTSPATATTTTVASPAGFAPASLVSAGTNGVILTDPNGSTRTVTTEPMARAWLAPDGSVFMQRSVADSDPAAETNILVADVDDVVPLQLPDELAGPARLHDLATIDGRLTLLIETGAAALCANFEGCDGALYLYEVDTDRAVLLTKQSVWEAGWTGLALAETGVAVGTGFASATTRLFSATASPDREPVVSGALGLAEAYDDCGACPASFTIDRSGSYVAWIEPGDGAPTIVVSAPDEAKTRITLTGEAIDECCSQPEGFVSMVSGDLEVSDVVLTSADGVQGGRAVINRPFFRGDPPVAPLIIDLQTGAVTLGEPGTYLTFGYTSS